jgi:tetratricopeptide (TPR) repeat protein
MEDREDKSKIHIKLPSEFSSNVTIDDVDYNVLTEDMGAERCELITRVYLKGEIVFTKKADYSDIVKEKDLEVRLKGLMQQHHKSAVFEFVTEQSKNHKSKNEYFDEAIKLFRRGGGSAALELMKEGLEHFPSDPFLLSYYGYLVAIVGKKPEEGIEICQDAFKKLNGSVPFGSEFFYPAFYLNLGRAFLADNNKPEAMKAFSEGLKTDPENSDLRWELKKMGTRRRPPVPFLKRNNPINKYIGMIVRKLKGR